MATRCLGGRNRHWDRAAMQALRPVPFVSNTELWNMPLKPRRRRVFRLSRSGSPSHPVSRQRSHRRPLQRIVDNQAFRRSNTNSPLRSSRIEQEVLGTLSLGNQGNYRNSRGPCPLGNQRIDGKMLAFTKTRRVTYRPKSAIHSYRLRRARTDEGYRSS